MRFCITYTGDGRFLLYVKSHVRAGKNGCGFNFILYLSASEKLFDGKECHISEIGFVNVGFCHNFHGRVHVKYGYAGVDDVHVVVAENVGDCSAAALIDFAQFCGLEMNILFVEGISYFSHEFGHSVVGAGLAASAGVLIKHDTVIEVCRVFGVVYFGEEGVEARADVAGQHFCVGERFFKRDIAVVTLFCQKIGN